MEKENLIKLAEHLYQSALDANAYYAIMMQYRELRKKYEDEMKISPAFYQVVYGTLQKACFMEVAKLYDATDVSMKQLLQCCRDNRALFPEYRDIVMVKEDDREYFFQVPYQYYLNPTEECFFENEVKIQRELWKYRRYRRNLNTCKVGAAISEGASGTGILENHERDIC